MSVDIEDPKMVAAIRCRKKTTFQLVETPKKVHMLGRFLLKIGLELLCLDGSEKPRTDRFAQARRFSRFGQFDGLWPIFYASFGRIRDLRRIRMVDGETLEDVDYYSYRSSSSAGAILFCDSKWARTSSS